ncbi:MAG: cytochrome c [Bdellovibrionales bacterium]|nr:cytochrome c [Bdellovibrionales bacterium]
MLVTEKSLHWAFMFCMSLFVAVFLFGLTGCSDKTKPNIEVIQDMMEQPALKAQDFMPDNREKSSMLVPPEGTLAVDREAAKYATDPEAAGKNLKMPTVTPEFLALGERHYKNYCLLCHGEKGMGDGHVGQKFIGVKPPSLMTDKIRGYADGRIFHVLTFGQGVMGNYMYQMPKGRDRWAVVAYVRKMQQESK